MNYLVFRLACSFLSGVILSQTGSLIQLSSRNILASPSTLGFDGLSVLWILLLHSLFLMTGNDLSFVVQLSLGALVFIGIGWWYSRLSRHGTSDRVILIGLTFNLFVGVLFALWQFLFLAFNLPFPAELWFGHFKHASLQSMFILALFEVLFMVFFISNFRELLKFSFGPVVSRSLQLDRRTLSAFIIISVSLGTFLVVSLFGSFAFLGLVFPLIARELWFPRYDLKGEFLAGAFANGFLLMAIDFLCYQHPIYGAEIPVGLIASAVGALSLILLLWKSHMEKE